MPKYQEWIIIRSTGDYENAIEGGYNAIYEIVGLGMGRETGKLIYDIRGPSIPSTINSELAEGMGRAIADVRSAHSGPIVRNIFDLETIDDDVVSELRDRGVEIIIERVPAV